MGEARCIWEARTKNRSPFFFSRQSALAQTHFHPKGRGGDGAWVVLMLRDDEDSNEDQDGLRLSISFVESLTLMKVGQWHCKLKAGNFGNLEDFGRSCST